MGDAEECALTYEVERKPLKAKTEAPKEVDFMSELSRGRFSLTCNINHGGRVCTAKVFDKSDPEGDDAAKRELKNLKSLRHERMVTLLDAFETSKSGTQIKGTYNFDYAAPEIIEDAQAYPQSDMWSLGVLLYVMLSGQLPFKGESAEETRENIVNVRFKFEWLYKEVTMEATRLLMWIFKQAPWKRPLLEEVVNHRWLNSVDYMAKKRERASFTSNRIQKFARDYHCSRPQFDLDAASFFSKLM